MPQSTPFAWLATRPELAVAIAAFAALFIMLKLFTRSLGRAWDETAAGLATRLGALEHAVEQVRLERHTGAAPSAETGAPGMDRALAVAMMRRGSSAEAVAAEIGVPVGEVELLAKLERFLTRQSG